ncbi:hypothetical protein DERF_002729 [Dermatophagoides farinae]|uniref:Uncharacterized protein n=1 Tax=Dermatophagoides farinae TaxID=6954 RepID=A0A922IGN7_DERFA|nr:hypothetical protein DERF_002729 [Dermatophagoides farinae]
MFTNQQQKHQPKFLGPFIAVSTENPLIFNLVGNDGVQRRVHVNQLKICHDQTSNLALLAFTPLEFSFGIALISPVCQ